MSTRVPRTRLRTTHLQPWHEATARKSPLTLTAMDGVIWTSQRPLKKIGVRARRR